MNVLSTKLLPQYLVEKLENVGIKVTMHSFISTSSNRGLIIPTDYPLTVITSKNAVKALLDNQVDWTCLGDIYCVGEKTTKLVKSYGGKVVKTFSRLIELADDLKDKHQYQRVLYCCGNKKQPHLSRLSQNKQNFELLELEVYQTQLNPKKIDTAYDVALFLSPSAVKSYTMNNQLETTTCIAIGKTTASALEKAKEVIIADKQTLEAVVDACLEFYKNKANSNQ